jgi:hypothetical protein
MAWVMFTLVRAKRWCWAGAAHVAAKWPGWLQAVVDKHPTGIISLAWDRADTQFDAEVEASVRAAAGRLVLLYVPTSSPWLNPMAMR